MMVGRGMGLNFFSSPPMEILAAFVLQSGGEKIRLTIPHFTSTAFLFPMLLGDNPKYNNNQTPRKREENKMEKDSHSRQSSDFENSF